MNEKVKIICNNQVDIKVLDKDFYLSLLSNIVDLKNKKKEVNKDGLCTD